MYYLCKIVLIKLQNIAKYVIIIIVIIITYAIYISNV